MIRKTKLKAEEWAKMFKIEIIDPDGWRNEKIDWEMPITEDKFMRLVSVSTIQPLSDDFIKKIKENG